MTEKGKKLVEKLEKENEFLNEGHKTWVQYSNARIIIGIFLVLLLVFAISQF